MRSHKANASYKPCCGGNLQKWRPAFPRLMWPGASSCVDGGDDEKARADAWNGQVNNSSFWHSLSNGLKLLVYLNDIVIFLLKSSLMALPSSGLHLFQKSKKKKYFLAPPLPRTRSDNCYKLWHEFQKCHCHDCFRGLEHCFFPFYSSLKGYQTIHAPVVF